MSRIFPLNLAIFIKELTVTPRKGMADSIVVTGARTRVGELLRTIEERERRLHSIRATAFKARDFVEVERARSGGTKTWHLKVNVMFQEIASTQESIRSLKVLIDEAFLYCEDIRQNTDPGERSVGDLESFNQLIGIDSLLQQAKEEFEEYTAKFSRDLKRAPVDG